jgi:hypothetical protein
MSTKFADSFVHYLKTGICINEDEVVFRSIFTLGLTAGLFSFFQSV